jgi:hypothetical protein
MVLHICGKECKAKWVEINIIEWGNDYAFT